jgi:enediyne biosynthesis protein E4
MTITGGQSAARNTIILFTGVLVGVVVTGTVVLTILPLVRGNGPTQALPAPSFVEESASSGIDHMYGGGFQYFVGGGVAVFDCNDDMFADLYIAGGTEPGGLFVNESESEGNIGFRRLRDPTTDLVDVTGAYPIDIDSDGIIDLVVLRVGENVLLRGLGDCRFERANELWGVDGGDAWTVSFSATWEEGQSRPTLAFGNYLSSTDPGASCDDHQLIRPQGEGYSSPVNLSPGWCTLSILFSDWSRRGNVDLRMTNDRHYYRDGEEQLWRVDPGEEPALYTAADGWRTLQIWGMGIASHDLTGDGRPEVFLTSQGDNKLQTLMNGPDRPAYRDIALERGATAHRPFTGDTDRPSTAWHAEFGDVNNDGLMDLFVTKGNVDSMPEFAMDDPNNLLIGQPDGTFIEGALDAGVVDYGRSRGGALVDLNLSGSLDMIVVEREDPVRLWRNLGSPGSWLIVELRQAAPNVHAVGARIEVRAGGQVTEREVTIGGGHAGGQLGLVHFGLGDANSAELRVTWPDGEVTGWSRLEPNQFVVVDRSDGSITSRR